MPKPGKPAVGAARAALLESAAALFAQRGFEGASTHEIAARARVPQGLIRHHFGAKEALWREVVRSGLSDLNTAIEPSVAEPGPLTDPAAIWTAALLAQHELVQLLLHALFEPGRRRSWLILELSACAPAGSLIAWARGGEDHAQLTHADQDAVLICMRIVSLCAVPALLPVLETLRGHGIDAAIVARAVREAFDRGLRVTARGSVAGPWSLAAAAQRRTRTANAP